MTFTHSVCHFCFVLKFPLYNKVFLFIKKRIPPFLFWNKYLRFFKNKIRMNFSYFCLLFWNRCWNFSHSVLICVLPTYRLRNWLSLSRTIFLPSILFSQWKRPWSASFRMIPGWLTLIICPFALKPLAWPLYTSWLARKGLSLFPLSHMCVHASMPCMFLAVIQ